MNRIAAYLAVTLVLVFGAVWVAAQVTLRSFQPGDVIRSEDVNANFEALRDAIASGGGTGGLSSVTSDASLAGDGTSGSPLSIATEFRLPVSCAGGQIPAWDGSAWTCSADAGGTTTYSAGPGLELSGTTFSVAFSGSGSADQVARSDHDHIGSTWSAAVGNLFALDRPFGGYGTDVGALQVSVGNGLAIDIVNSNEAGCITLVQTHGIRTCGVAVGLYLTKTSLYGVYMNDTTAQMGVHVRGAQQYGAYLQGGLAGVYATGLTEDVPDLILGGDFSIPDPDSDGLLASDLRADSSDLRFRANGDVSVELDDNDDEAATFTVVNGSGTTVLTVDESGNLTSSGVVSNMSDRNAKRDIVPVDTTTVLSGVLATPVYRWSFDSDPSVTHIGPMAQDFRGNFDVGDSDTRISTIDPDGVALASIQALYAMIEQRDARIAEHEATIAGQALALEALEARIDALESGD